jgi:hypothetical protein
VEKLLQTVGAVYDVKSIEAYVILMTDESQRVRYDTAPVNTVGAVARRWKTGGKNYRTGSDGRYFFTVHFSFWFLRLLNCFSLSWTDLKGDGGLAGFGGSRYLDLSSLAGVLVAL